MKILFLDMDGVVNSDDHIENWIKIYKKSHSCSKNEAVAAFHKEFCNGYELIFPDLAVKVSEIVSKTGCKIVWSSFWRRLRKCSDISNAKEMFDRRGLPGAENVQCGK